MRLIFTLTCFLAIIYQFPQFESKDLYGKWTVIMSKQGYYSICGISPNSAIIGSTFNFKENNTLTFNYQERDDKMTVDKIVWKIRGNAIFARTNNNKLIEFENVRLYQDSLFFRIGAHNLTLIKK